MARARAPREWSRFPRCFPYDIVFISLRTVSQLILINKEKSTRSNRWTNLSQVLQVGRQCRHLCDVDKSNKWCSRPALTLTEKNGHPFSYSLHLLLGIYRWAVKGRRVNKTNDNHFYWISSRVHNGRDDGGSLKWVEAIFLFPLNVVKLEIFSIIEVYLEYQQLVELFD